MVVLCSPCIRLIRLCCPTCLTCLCNSRFVATEGDHDLVFDKASSVFQIIQQRKASQTHSSTVSLLTLLTLLSLLTLVTLVTLVTLLTPQVSTQGPTLEEKSKSQVSVQRKLGQGPDLNDPHIPSQVNANDMLCYVTLCYAMLSVKTGAGAY
jgi:hypothetical protein